MENNDNYFCTLDENFVALFDAAQEARAQIAAAIKTSDAKIIGGTQFCALHVSDHVNFRAAIIYAYKAGRPDISDWATLEERDCTVEEIRDCAARVIFKINQSSRRARIEQLRKQLKEEVARLEAEEGADNGK